MHIHLYLEKHNKQSYDMIKTQRGGDLIAFCTVGRIVTLHLG